MNNLFIRITTIAVFAMSLSSFGLSQEAAAASNTNLNNINAKETAVPSAVEQHYSDGIDALKQEIGELRQEIQELRKEEQNSRKLQLEQMEQQQQQIKQQEQEWLHYLQNLSPG